MSATMDLSPLKIETSSAHSSPHRTPGIPSPTNSSPGKDADIPLPFTSIVFGRNTEAGVLPGYSRLELEGGVYQTTSKLSNSCQVSPFSQESSPVKANFLVRSDSENHEDKLMIDKTRDSPSRSDFLDQREEVQPQLQQRLLNEDRQLSSPKEALGLTEQRQEGNPPPPKKRGLNSSCGGSPISEKVEMPEDFDNNDNDTDQVIEANDDSGDDDSDRDDEDDQVECARCSSVFSSLQSYMNHSCYTSQVLSRNLSRNTKPRSPASPLDFERFEIDAVSFEGKFIFNQNGSVSVIETSSMDRECDEDLTLLPDSVVISQNQSVLSVDYTLPPVYSIGFFPKNDSFSVFSQSIYSVSPKSSLNMHRYNVFDLDSPEASEFLHKYSSVVAHKQPTRPILMCIICKLVFGKSKLFVRHAIYSHSIHVSETEQLALCQHAVSLICHPCGRDRHPRLSILHPVFDLTTGLPDLRSAMLFSRGKVAEYVPNGSFSDNMMMFSRDYSSCPFPFQGRELTTQTRNPFFEQRLFNVSLKGNTTTDSIQKSSTPGAIKQNIKTESHMRPSSPVNSLVSTANGLNCADSRNPSQAGVNDTSALRLRSSPSAVNSAQHPASSPCSSGSDSFLQTSSSVPNSSVTSIPALIMSTVSPSTLPPHVNLSSSNSSPLQPIGLQLPHFLCACDEHPQGKAQGVECPKCDMVLSSSQSLGGHMTMTHSRNSCKTLKCPKCNWHYKYQETLEIHMKEKHPDSDAQCVYCLTNQAHPRLARGESYSCGYKPYRCEVCNYSTTTKGNLSIHMQSDKHINNMQDLAAGNSELKLQPQQPPSTTAVPPSAPTPLQNSTASYSQEECQFKKVKQKQSFRCDVCSYETSVARNLRIHMTSEKHTHNMLVMTQSINHLHQDMALQQMSQMNQLLAINQQEQAARFAALSPHIPSAVFSYEQAAMLMSSATTPHPSGFEIPINLTKENGTDECEGPVPKKDATKMFQCCICYKYGSDSIENVHNHIQYDRTKTMSSDAYVTFNSGTYHCNLCSYKTHLKANFQLHCKTDKHLQKLQLVNHILEGGSENEWRLANTASSMQICCNACSFYANSIYKMQLHLSSIQHESCAQLFRHLQLLDHATPPPASGSLRYYQCTLCATNVRTKQRLILHSRSAHHVRKEQSLPQGQVSIFDVYLIKEMKEGESIAFEDEAADDYSVDSPESSEISKDPTSNTSSHTKITATSVPPPAHNTTSASSSYSETTVPSFYSASSRDSPATNYSLLRNEAAADRTRASEYDGDRHDRPMETLGVARSLALTSRSSGGTISTGIPVNNGTLVLNSSTRCEQSDSNVNSSIDCRVSISRLSSSPCPSFGSRQGAPACILCPLCRHECADGTLLEAHLVKEHNVAPEGVQRLMSMVDMPATTMTTAPSENTSAASPADSSTALVRSSSSPSLVSSADDPTVSRTPDEQMECQTSDLSESRISKNGGLQLPSTAAAATADSYTGTSTLSVNSASSQRSLSVSPSPSSSSLAPLMSYAMHTTSGSSFISSSSDKSAKNENRALYFKYEEKEINLQILEADHINLLANEGVDLAAQEKLEKEFQELFRCQTCSKCFGNIDFLYSHQNELGHLELKQTPRGPGYLCWKKGCNQYFKTASSLQVHFREIHAMRSSIGILPSEELDMFKFKCGQCSFSFKSLEVMQKHTLIHLMQSIIQCQICCRKVSSVSKMRRHLETDHLDLSLSDMTMQMESIEANAQLLFSSPTYEQFTSKMLLKNGNIHSRNGISNNEKALLCKETLANGINVKNIIEQDEEFMEENENGLEQNYKDKQFLEDYMNSLSMAEEHYKSSERKYKCHRCRVAFTNQRYLFSHNKTSLHRKNEQSERFDDPSRPYRCEACKESFTQKSILLVHYNSVSHLHKVKQQTQVNGDNLLTSSGSHLTPPPLSSSPKINSPTATSHSNGSYNTMLDTAAGSNSNMKPYKCNICKVSYNNQPSIEIHLRSVGHKTKASKLGELIQTGQVDVHQALIEHPDPRTAGKQQAQIIADMIHQQATAQAASNAAASYFNLQGINAVAQLSLLGIIPSTSQYLLTSAQNALATMSNAQLEAYYSSIAAQFNKDGNRTENTKLTSPREFGKEKPLKINSYSDSTDKAMNVVIKQDGKIEPAGSGHKTASGISETKSSGEGRVGRKEDDLPPNFHAPIIARPRGFMGRFKPQLHRSLLENFGFECVMHFNEENSVKPKEVDSKDEDAAAKNDSDEKKEKNDINDKVITMEVDKNDGENKEENVDDEESKDCESEDKEERKDENKENIDLPELSKCRCRVCKKDFSNVWVLKNHEEEIHNNFVSPEVIEDFGQKFKEEWEKNLPKPVEQEIISSSQSSSTSPTPATMTEKVTEMPPPPPPSQPQLSGNYDMSQLLPLMGMNLLPMHLPMNLVNLGLQNPLMPSLLMPTVDLSSGFLPQMPPPSIVDSASSVSSQQQLQAAAAAAAAVAQNQKRVRTRITDDQLKVLRQYFDINNSPSEEQINKMSDQTGLPQKVIKHWFRNTLFKERQRNKDSPYNFNNPPSTSIDLDEYDRTGKIPEIKLEPEEEEEDVDTVLVSEVKKESPSVSEEGLGDRSCEHDTDLLESVPLKIDLAPKTEPLEEGRKDQESPSSSSSPSVSSIPSTPTASGPATPTPMITPNSVNPANSLAFSLDAYAANMARLEAATLQIMGKRANRTRFTDYQIKTLQDYFERNAYPKDDELEHLSKVLGLSARVIVVWFQNARQKARKIYENQPTNEGVKDSVSPFQRTPGLNYQCKKCNSVFQRYYELIKHQKTSCVGESNNNKPIPSMTEDDSNFSYSNDDSNISERQSTPSSGNKDRDILLLPSRSQNHELSSASSTGTAKIPGGSSLPVITSSHPSSSSASSSSSSATIPFFKCDKCNLTFSRFDMWQEHQKAHNIAPAMYTPFSSSSAFGMLQTLAHQEDGKATLSMAGLSTPCSLVSSVASLQVPSSQQPGVATLPSAPLSTSPTLSSKRKTDSEDEGGEQPRDKRLRTTILPEQLDYLYQQYQIDCNPSRKQLEHIANTVNLKKRVVQVWFQNTRARERKGHYRAHQQLINKRCPFCRALFRAKSALESHLATKHPEEMAKGDINIDLIPDAVIEPQSSQMHSSLPSSSSAHGASSSHSMPDISKLLPPGAAASIPNYMTFMSSASGLNLPFPGPAPEMVSHPPFEDPFFKKYMSDLASSMVARQEPPAQSSLGHHTIPATLSAHSSLKQQTHQSSTNFSSTTRPLETHKLRTTVQTPAANDDAPLDLSKPIRLPVPDSGIETPQRPSYSGNLDFTERPMEVDYLRRLSSMDDSFSETQSEMADHDYMNDIGNSPPSPSHASNGLSHSLNVPGSSGKRYRTQMSAVQVKVMKHLFQDYKTPTMAECELLGQEIGLAKRVVQVWFQNARAKEKKAKLNSGKPFSAEDFPKSPEECKLCNYKYSHKVTVQDHIFTKAHIDKVKAFLNSQSDRDSEVPSTNLHGLSRPHGETERSHKIWNDSVSNSHIAQLQAMGINPATVGYPLCSGESSLKAQEKESQRKEKNDALSAKDSQQQAQNAIEMTMNAQMLSALGGYMPGLDPAYLSYMYSGIPGYFPGMGLSMMQPGLIPEHMLTYDPLVFGTPLPLLQIPAAAIKSVSEKLSEAGALLARYTQDCQALADLHNMVSAADLTVAAEATLDVGYICKKCQMVYPARESCVAHQRSVCMASSSLPKGFEPIMKLEQVQYECRACSERFSTILEFKSHCQLEVHKQRLLKFKAKEAARRESAGSPSSSAPYSSSISKVMSPSPSYSSNPLTPSPSNNNNNNNNNSSNNNHGNGQMTIPSPAHASKPTPSPSPSHQYRMLPAAAAPTVFRDKHSPGFSELADMKRLKAE